MRVIQIRTHHWCITKVLQILSAHNSKNQYLDARKHLILFRKKYGQNAIKNYYSRIKESLAKFSPGDFFLRDGNLSSKAALR